MNVRKYDINVLNSIGDNREKVLEYLKSMGYSDKRQAYNVWYNFHEGKLKGSIFSNRGSQPQVNTNTNVNVETKPEVQLITPNSVIRTDTIENEESKDLKDTYSNMLKEFESDNKSQTKLDYTTSNTENDYESISESSEDKQEDEDEGKAGDSNRYRDMGSNDDIYKLRLGKLLHMFGRNLNNVVWSERPLTVEEEVEMQPFSDNIEATFSSSLVNENNPIYGYLLAYGALPLVARIDLLPAKINGFFEWLNKITKKNTPPPQPPPQPKDNPNNVYANKNVEPVTNNIVVEPPVTPIKNEFTYEPEVIKEPERIIQKPSSPFNNSFNYEGLSTNQRLMIENYRSLGYTIEPDFNPNLPIDVDALRERICRNKLYRR